MWTTIERVYNLHYINEKEDKTDKDKTNWGKRGNFCNN